jgi:hypothetical protein
MADIKKFEQELRDARRDVRKLTVIAMRPDLHPRDIELVKALERMARLEVRLRLEHLNCYKSQSTEG